MLTTQNVDADYVAPMIVHLADGEAKNTNGQLIYADSADIPGYQFPLSPVTLVRKTMRKWTTLDELVENIISCFRLGFRGNYRGNHFRQKYDGSVKPDQSLFQYTGCHFEVKGKSVIVIVSLKRLYHANAG